MKIKIYKRTETPLVDEHAFPPMGFAEHCYLPQLPFTGMRKSYVYAGQGKGGRTVDLYCYTKV